MGREVVCRLSPISYRQLEEMMGERGVAVDHSTLNRWVIKYARRLRNSSASPAIRRKELAA